MTCNQHPRRPMLPQISPKHPQRNQIKTVRRRPRMVRDRAAVPAGRDLIMLRTRKWISKRELRPQTATYLIHRRVILRPPKAAILPVWVGRKVPPPPKAMHRGAIPHPTLKRRRRIPIFPAHQRQLHQPSQAHHSRSPHPNVAKMLLRMVQMVVTRVPLRQAKQGRSAQVKPAP